jgi:glutathione S-transferase
MLKLHQFPPVFGRNVSPFTLKLEAWLKLTGLPYEVVPTRNPGRGPKGKLPFIEDEDGSVIGDSGLIIEHLKRTRGVDPDRELSARQRATALALQRLLEDHFYFIGVWSRWLDPDGWRDFGPALFASVPPPLGRIIGSFIRRRVRQGLHAQGLGRHSQAELYAMGRADLEAVTVLLGDQPFFFGDQPGTADTIAYGALDNLINVPIETELRRIGRSFPSLAAFCARMTARLETPQVG